LAPRCTGRRTRVIILRKPWRVGGFFDSRGDSMSRSVAVGLTILAGAALFEAALIPGVVIGGAAVLAPRYLPGLRRRLRPLFGAAGSRRAGRPVSDPPADMAADMAPPAAASGAGIAAFGIKQAIAKTITFRIIVTTLDFTTNVLVIGELATAAGLSTFNLVAGPLFYFSHEAVWNYLGPAETVDVPAGGFTMSRALAKTITFRTIATVVDFTANYVVVRDVATAAGLSAFGFVLGPFVYLGHEKAWEYFGTRRAPDTGGSAPPRLLPAPG
jgi:uncharacterized membrane protein